MRYAWRSMHKGRLHEAGGATEVHIITLRIIGGKLIAL